MPWGDHRPFFSLFLGVQCQITKELVNVLFVVVLLNFSVVETSNEATAPLAVTTPPTLTKILSNMVCSNK